MRCFELTERISEGILILRDPEPHIPADGFRHTMQLDPALARFIRDLPPGNVVLRKASLVLDKDRVVLGAANRWKDSRALVLISTASGVGGTIRLTANCHAEDFVHARVIRTYKEFPPPGVEIVGNINHTPENDGCQGLYTLVRMEKGASFRIERGGRLEGASPELFAHWNGRNLLVTTRKKHDKQAQQSAPL